MSHYNKYNLNSLYRYFSDINHMQKFIERGEVYCNSLSFFLSCEEKSRRDETEDACVYRPLSGLEVFNQTTQTKPILSMQFNSKVKEPNRIFIFCMSGVLSETLYKKFKAQACVEIFNADEFRNRLSAKISSKFKEGILKNDQLLSDFVTYVSTADPPGVRHACPDQIIMAKSDRFKDEVEYRFAFADCADAFEVNNVEYTLSEGTVPTLSTKEKSVLEIGPLSDICKVTEDFK